MKKLLKDKGGEMYLRACFLIMIISIVFVLVWTFCLTIVLASGQRKSAIQTLDKYTQLNAIDIHNSIKMSVDDTASLDPSIYISSLCLAQGLTEDNGAYAAINAKGNYRFTVSDVKMSFTEELTTKIQVSYNLNIPFRFMGSTTWLEIPLTIYSRLDPKFFQNGQTTMASYTVRHWKQTLSGTYELAEQWTLYDAVGSTVKPKTAIYPGFKTPAVKAIIVSADRKKVVDYYYDRVSYTVTISAGEGVKSVVGAGTYKFGETVVVGATLDTEAGYLLPNWSGDTKWIMDPYARFQQFEIVCDVNLSVSSVASVGTYNEVILVSSAITTASAASKSGPVVDNYYKAFTPSAALKTVIRDNWGELYSVFQILEVRDVPYQLVNYEEAVWSNTPYVVLYYASPVATYEFALVIPYGAASIEFFSNVAGTFRNVIAGYMEP